MKYSIIIAFVFAFLGNLAGWNFCYYHYRIDEPRTIKFQTNRGALHYPNGVPIFPDSVRAEKYLYKGQIYQPSTSYYSITFNINN